MKKHIEYFISQPHQIFFTLGMINAIFSMFIFMLSYKGTLSIQIDPTLFHAYSLIFTTFTSFFAGFLFTTFPKFGHTTPIKSKLYNKIFFMFFVATILIYLSLFISAKIWILAMVLLFIGHYLVLDTLIRIYHKAPTEDKDDMFWILTALLFGLIAHLLYILSYFYTNPWIEIAKLPLAIYLYLIFLAVVIGSKMVPFFSHSLVKKNPHMMQLIFTLFALRVTMLAWEIEYIFLLDFITALLLGYEIYRWKLPFPNNNPILWILHLAIFWLPLGFLLSATSALLSFIYHIEFLFLDIHILLLGFLTTMLIGFGTRVTLGHSHNNMHADKITIYLFYLTQIVTLSRIAVSIVAALGNDITIIFDITAFIWIILFLIWSIKYLPVLLYGKNLYTK
jgi:uncharacterized protein involved in response to NO